MSKNHDDFTKNSLSRPRSVRLGVGGTEKWWQSLEIARENFEKTGEWSGKNGISSWCSTTRGSWKKGNLSYDQIMALKKAGFDFTGSNAKTNKTGLIRLSGGDVDIAMQLKQKQEMGPPLTKAESEQFETLLHKLKGRYRLGSLSEKSAKTLGIS